MSETNRKEIFTGTAVPVRGNDIDTDRIIPARYLKCITFDGLGEFAFYDERYDEKGNPKKHPFNEETYKGASILVANKNFGCGSSREHAPQALKRSGINVIIGESFAEIFAGNCRAIGIPTLSGTEKDVLALMNFVEKNPESKITADVRNKKIIYGGMEFSVDIPESVWMDIVNGTWDSTALLLANKADIEKTAARLAYLGW